MSLEIVQLTKINTLSDKNRIPREEEVGGTERGEEMRRRVCTGDWKSRSDVRSGQEEEEKENEAVESVCLRVDMREQEEERAR